MGQGRLEDPENPGWCVCVEGGGERWIKIIFKKHIVVAMNTRSVHEKDTVEGRKCMPRLFRPVQNTKGVLIILMIHEEHGERG